MARKIEIFEGPIRGLYANDFTLVENKIVPVTRKVIVKEDSLYYLNRFRKFINMDNGSCLCDEREAMDLIYYIIERNQALLYKALSDSTVSFQRKEKLFSELTLNTAFMYYDPYDFVKTNEMSPKAFNVFYKKHLQEAQKTK